MVPFPAILELLILELAFELIREAGIRVPTPIGPTIGIVGALILGQAGVEANVVSPIVVIVVALSGLASYAISDINLNYMIRTARFAFLMSAGCIWDFWNGVMFYGLFKLFNDHQELRGPLSNTINSKIPFWRHIIPRSTDK